MRHWRQRILSKRLSSCIGTMKSFFNSSIIYFNEITTIHSYVPFMWYIWIFPLFCYLFIFLFYFSSIDFVPLSSSFVWFEIFANKFWIKGTSGLIFLNQTLFLRFFAFSSFFYNFFTIFMSFLIMYSDDDDQRKYETKKSWRWWRASPDGVNGSISTRTKLWKIIPQSSKYFKDVCGSVLVYILLYF